MCQRTGSPRSSSRDHGIRRLLRRQQPPVMRLPAAVDLGLDRVGGEGGHLVDRDRRPLALDDRDDLGALGQRLDRRRERRAGPAPGDHLAVDEPDGVAADEPPLGVVTGGRRDRPGPGLASASVSRVGVRPPRSAAGSSSIIATSPACWEVQSRTCASRSESSAACSAARIDVRRVREARSLPRRRPSGFRPAARRSRGSSSSRRRSPWPRAPRRAAGGRRRRRPRRGRSCCPPTASRRSRSATCSRMSASSTCEIVPCPSKTSRARGGSSVWTWTRSVRRSPTIRTESPISRSERLERRRRRDRCPGR